MSKSLDFNTVKKTPFVVTLRDKNKTKLLITTPTMAMLKRLEGLQSRLTEYETLSEGEMADLGILDELYKMVADLMSRNVGNKNVTTEQLAEIMDFEDLVLFIRAYVVHIKEVLSQKN